MYHLFEYITLMKLKMVSLVLKCQGFPLTLDRLGGGIANYHWDQSEVGRN